VAPHAVEFLAMMGLKEWLPPANWPNGQTRQFIYLAAGLAERRLGARGRITIGTRAEAGGGVIEGTWNDDSDRVVLTTVTHYPAEGPVSQSLEFGDGDRIYADTDMRQKQLVIARTSRGQKSGARIDIDTAQPLDWSVTWAFRLVHIPWSAGLSGPFFLGDVDWSPSGPSNDGYRQASLQTGESTELVDTPNGQRNVECWRIESAGQGISEVASIAKTGEGLIRFDMNMMNSALLIGIAG
jgi:hypothetical protein